MAGKPGKRIKFLVCCVQFQGVTPSGQFSSVPLPFVWRAEENLTVGLAAISGPSTGATLDAYLNGVLTGISVYDANGSLDSSFEISSASGTIYSANGVSPVPEPEPYALLLAGLVLIGFMANRAFKGSTEGRINQTSPFLVTKMSPYYDR